MPDKKKFKDPFRLIDQLLLDANDVYVEMQDRFSRDVMQKKEDDSDLALVVDTIFQNTSYVGSPSPDILYGMSKKIFNYFSLSHDMSNHSGFRIHFSLLKGSYDHLKEVNRIAGLDN